MPSLVGSEMCIRDRPRALRVATPWSLGLADSDTLEERRQPARLPSKIFYLDYGGLRMDRISEVAPAQVCWTLWRPTPPLQHPTGQLQPWPRARTPSQPRVAVTESENSACYIFLAPRSVDGILDFSMDPAFLATFRIDTDFNGDCSTDTFFLLLFRVKCCLHGF